MKRFKETIKETVEALLNKMGFVVQVEIYSEEISNSNLDEQNIVANIISSEAGYLIGHKGVNLYALQHLARLIVLKKLKDDYQDFILDVNDYRKDRAEIIKEMAISKAEQAVREKREIVFQPMAPYERRIIHLVLAQKPDVICESEGEGEERHIVIKPVV